MAVWLLHFAVLTGCLSMFSTGISFGWSSPTMPLLAEDNIIQLPNNGPPWLMSLMFFGSAVGSIISILLVDVIGRKNTLLFTVIPTTASWLLIAVSTSLMELYAARFLVGLSNGVISVTLPMYIAEISPVEKRGFMTTFVTFMKCAGIIYAFAVIPFLSVRTFAYTTVTFSIIFFFAFICCPESPFYLIHAKSVEAARESLKKLRADDNIILEMESIRNATTEMYDSEFKVRDVIPSTIAGNRRVITLGFGLMLICASSGEVTIINNAEKLFDMVENAILDGKYLSIILSCAELTSLLVCSSLVDRVGRKPLLVVSALGVSISSIFIGCYYYLQNEKYFVDSLSWTATLGLIIYVVFAGLGLISIPLAVNSEIFPLHLKAACTGLTLAMYYLFILVSISIFTTIIDYLNAFGTFWILAGINFLSAMFIIVAVPETKLKTLAEISSSFRNNWSFRKRDFVSHLETFKVG